MAGPRRRSHGAAFTVETFGRYFMHDPIHHLDDVTGNPALAELAPSRPVSPCLRHRKIKTVRVEFLCYHRDRPGSMTLRGELREKHWSYMDGYAAEVVARGPTPLTATAT